MSRNRLALGGALALVAVALVSGAPRRPTAAVTPCGAFDLVFADPAAWRCFDQGRCTVCRHLGTGPAHVTTVCTESGERRAQEMPEGIEISICRPQVAAGPQGAPYAASAQEDGRCAG